MRKIHFATEKVTGNTIETFYFIAILVVFAMVASATVLKGGMEDKERNRFKLVLHCIMIITSGAHSLLLTHSYSLTHSLTHSLTRSLTHLLTYLLTYLLSDTT